MNPNESKNNVNKVLCIIYGAITLFISYFLSGCYLPGKTIFEMYEVFEEHIKKPFDNYWNKYTINALFIGIVAFAVIWAMYMLSQKNLMNGREYGSMKFNTPKALDKRFKDKKNNKRDPNMVPVLVERKLPIPRRMKVLMSPKIIYINTNQRRLSENIHFSLNTRQHGLNDNVLIIGGSGSGKTFYEVKPNALDMTGSYIFTDPKGELLRSCGGYLEKNGYKIKVINLLDRFGILSSTRYNPFVYLKSETDVTKLVTNIFENTDDKNAAKGEPFWDNAGKMLLKALVYYVWLEAPANKMNFGYLIDLLAKADFKVGSRGEKKDSELDLIFRELEENECKKMHEAHERGEEWHMHPAVSAYNSVMKGAADTVRSIILTLDTKLDNFKIAEVKSLLSDDEMNIPEIGCGVNMDGKTKTALFCVIPDNDTSFNFLIGTLYTQIFQQLYFTADFVYGGKLPIHVTFMLDEFANIPLPDDYIRLLSTMRSREISSVIILQNMAQIEELFEKGWKSIPGNCDTQIFLGSGENETGESISKQLGKGTIDKKTQGITKGKQGSSSQNFDRLGRELMMPEEVRLMDNKKCLIFIRGQYPCMDYKTRTQNHKLFKQLATDDNPYVFDANKARREQANRKDIKLVTNVEMKYMSTEAERSGKNIMIYDCTAEEIINLNPDTDYQTAESLISDIEMQRNRIHQQEEYEDLQIQRKHEDDENRRRENLKSDIKNQIKSATPQNVRDLMKLKKDGYSDEQLQYILILLKNNVPYSDIKDMFSTEMTIQDIKNAINFMNEICD